MPAFNFVRASFYQDPVTLMRLSRDMEAVPGVTAAAAMMGTPHNRELLQQAGLLAPEGAAAGPADLVIAVIADSPAAADAARAAAEHALLARRAIAVGNTTAAPPRTLTSALKILPDANLALISVPGAYAGAEALQALRAGLHVLLFSDNVPVETEVALKRLALERGLLMMGPDCGTAIVDGVPLGFANAVPRGRIGLAAASGTGLQETTCTIAREGEGVSQAIGVGGRDLSDEVGGLMMLRALELLAGRAATEVVCLVGKPPGAGVARRLADAAAKLGKPCVAYFAGASTPAAGPWRVAATLEDAGRAAVALARGTTPAATAFTLAAAEVERLVADAARGLAPGQRYVRGVYSGGTLAYEAIDLLAGSLAEVATSLTTGGSGHRVVDLGEDVFTVGRPHPMIDGRVRREWIDREGRDAGTAVLLVDVVLGYGAHRDPAGEIVPAIRAVRARRPLAVVASVCGTDGDPQSRAAQIATLRDAGVIVMDGNAQAARLAAAIARRAGARSAASVGARQRAGARGDPGRDPLRGLGGHRRRRARAGRARRRAARALPPPRHRGADGGRRHALDAGVRRREPGPRHARPRDDQRGTRQSAPIRRQRRQRAGAPQLDRHGGGAAARRRAARARRHRSARADGAGAAHGRRDAPAQPGGHRAAHARDDAGDRAGRRAPPRRRAPRGVPGGQRPVLPEPRDGRGKVDGRSRRRRRRLNARDRHGAQRHRLRHPRLGLRRALVHRPREHAARPLFPRLRSRRREPRHGRQRDRRDDRPRRVRDGGRAGGGALPRRRRHGRGGGDDRGDARDLRRRAPALPHPRPRRPRQPRGRGRAARGRDLHHAGHQHGDRESPRGRRPDRGGRGAGTPRLLHGRAGSAGRGIEERHGFPGALRTLGSVRGHFGAPHVHGGAMSGPPMS